MTQVFLDTNVIIDYLEKTSRLQTSKLELQKISWKII